jgi:predicted nucleotidyltransferase component of viral defense system
VTRLLRSDLDELDAYVTRIAASTGIPAAHIEKDYWVTEALRGVAAASRETGCSIVFKGGTSLSKAHHLIQRFSEDVDLIAVLPAGGTKSKDTILKSFVAAAAATTGLTIETDEDATTRGVKRTAVLAYPTAHDAGVLRPGVLVEVGTRGGALPQRRLAVQSLITEYAESIDLPVDFEEAAPVSILVLEPVRTLVDKLVLLHHAATEGDDTRRAITARHYYDVDRLLRNDDIIAQLTDPPVDVLAREVTEHSTAAGLPTADRPKGGFAASPAWNPEAAQVAGRAYEHTVLPNLVWPGAPRSTFDECCARVHELADLL